MAGGHNNSNKLISVTVLSIVKQLLFQIRNFKSFFLILLRSALPYKIRY